ncbi:hypothetical protein HYV83_05620 [Candidatus Woesearchaeota archaeon]|nr:hypothetical protein [Candidatus Woesearchaeota archaeon]
MAKSKSTVMPSDSSLQSVGSWAFLLGVVVALLVGVFMPDRSNQTVTSFLLLLGVIVGLLNITTKETNSFLLAAVSLALVATLGSNVLKEVVAPLGTYLGSMLDSILVFVVPATIVVALKQIFGLAERR